LVEEVLDMNSVTLSLVLRLPLALWTIAALFYSVLLARSAYLVQNPSPSSIEAALRLIPYNADLITRLDTARPEPSPKLLTRALELNPFQANAWMRLGLNAELKQRNPALAERYYLEAAKVDHMYLPLWTLANFYARQGNKEKFFETAKAALAITPYDSRPLLFQAQMLAERPDQVLAILPDRQRVLFEYLNFLLSGGDSAQFESAALRATDRPMDASNEPVGLPEEWLNILGTTEDRLLQGGQRDEAMRIWASMQRNGWVHLPVPSVEAPLANGSFRRQLFGHGFDWSVLPVQGVMHDQYPGMGKMAFEFDGAQPESCRLLRQFIPVRGGGSYRMAWQLESPDIHNAVGLKWRIYPTAAKKDSDRAVLSSSDLSAGGQQNGSWEFTVPAGWTTALVTLEYDRPLGEVRTEGSVSLKKISMNSVSPANTGGSL
jgi:hypothetical protein